MSEKLIPLIYLIAVAAIAVLMTKFGVDKATTGLIVGAGITRIKIGMPTRQNGSA